MVEKRKEVLLKLRNNSWDEESWFLPLADALENINAAQAAWQPPGGGNTIWQTLNHLNYFNERYLAVIKGEVLGEPLDTNEATFGAPGNGEDERGWRATVQKTRDIMDDFKETINRLSEDDLDNRNLDVNLPDIMMHDAYHIGQIVLIRKMQGSWTSERNMGEMW
ncbi:DinB family protein [Paenibacillus alkalitolerans]|uniref:DinB family protein n=1 Tax=Paenibacillus alkalitolerans TaxID=2799335 RepID=UPI0018F63DB3|nr:DinB family protein [Paenibacillus alkalitolerans]